MNIETLEISCDDGAVLAGALLLPATPKAVVQFNQGTAAKRGVYRQLAEYLGAHDYAVCLWDYRGSGASRRASLKGSTIRYADYGLKDMPAVKAYLDARFPALPLYVVAHSTGGQQIGFMQNWKGIQGAVMMGVSAAHFAAMPTIYRLQAYYFFYAVVPAMHALYGYAAASKLKLMEDLPTPVANEWRDWLTVPDYFFDPKFYGQTVPIGGFKAFDFPIKNYHATDESISTPPNIKNFWKHIESTEPISFERISPQEVGLKRLDHFGYFKRAMEDRLWADIVRTLDGWVEQSAGSSA